MKMAPLIEAMNRYPGEIAHLLVHTVQHYNTQRLHSAISYITPAD